MFVCNGIPRYTALKWFHEMSSTTAWVMVLCIYLCLSDEPLTIAYSDWPGWIAWDVALVKGWFKEEDVNVKFLWGDYSTGVDAFSSGEVDAVAVTNGDALTVGRPCKCFLVNDYSSGNDKVVARQGIANIGQLRGKRIGLEIGHVSHLLFLQALQDWGMTECDVEIFNISTTQSAMHLARGFVDAIVAWQPHSGQALRSVPGAKAIFTSRDTPGLIYDMLCTTPELMVSRYNDWVRIYKVWKRIALSLQDPESLAEAVQIMSTRVSLHPAAYQELLSGTKIFTLAEAKAHMYNSSKAMSLYMSTEHVSQFFVANKILDQQLNVSDFIEPSIINLLAP